jgi:uncharacterized protein (TIGR02452 family)
LLLQGIKVRTNRTQRQKIAEETINILTAKSYTHAYETTVVSLAESIDAACAGTVLYYPKDKITPTFGPESSRQKSSLKDDKAPSSAGGSSGISSGSGVEVHVVNSGCIQAAKALVDQDSFWNVGVLNFASAKNPGGGFLNGSLAQEENICLCSALYSCINQKKVLDMYSHNRKVRLFFFLFFVDSNPPCRLYCRGQKAACTRIICPLPLASRSFGMASHTH